jgi:hypothetical protein
MPAVPVNGRLSREFGDKLFLRLAVLPTRGAVDQGNKGEIARLFSPQEKRRDAFRSESGKRMHGQSSGESNVQSSQRIR